MGAMASQITRLTIVYSTFYSGADQRKHKNSASRAFVRRIHRWPVNSPHKWPLTRRMFPFDDVIMVSLKPSTYPAQDSTATDYAIITIVDSRVIHPHEIEITCIFQQEKYTNSASIQIPCHLSKLTSKWPFKVDQVMSLFFRCNSVSTWMIKLYKHRMPFGDPLAICLSNKLTKRSDFWKRWTTFCKVVVTKTVNKNATSDCINCRETV